MSAAFESRPQSPDLPAEPPAEDTIAIGAGFDFADPHSPLARYYLRNAHVAAVVLLGLVFLFLNFVPLWHTDVWAHLLSGRYVAAHGALPPGNPFCPLLDQAVPSNHYCWLSQTALYGLFRLGVGLAGGDAANRLAGGVDVLRLTHALLVVLKLAILLAAFTRRAGSLRLALAGVTLVLLLHGANLAVFRPQAIGEVCFAVVLLALSRPTPSRAALVGVPALLVLWANLHGSFVVGLLLLAVLLAGRSFETAWQLRTWDARRVLLSPEVRPLWVLLLAAAAAIAALNPAGPWIYARTLAMTNHPVVLAMEEWYPLRFHLGSGGHWAYGITLLLLAASYAHARRWPTPTELLLILAFGSQPLQHQRAMVWWLLVLPWVVLPLWAARPETRLGRLWVSASEANLRKTLLAAAVAVVLTLWSIPGQWLIAGHPTPVGRSLSHGTPWRLAFQLQGVPTGDTPAVPGLDAWLAEHFPGGRFRGPLFTTETSGDYLLWALPPDAPVFMYSHVHLFPWEHWQRCAAVRFGTPQAMKVLDHYRVNLVAVEAELNPHLRDLLKSESGWQVLLDETGDARKPDYRCRWLVAVRKEPLPLR